MYCQYQLTLRMGVERRAVTENWEVGCPGWVARRNSRRKRQKRRMIQVCKGESCFSRDHGIRESAWLGVFFKSWLKTWRHFSSHSACVVTQKYFWCVQALTWWFENLVSRICSPSGDTSCSLCLFTFLLVLPVAAQESCPQQPLLICCLST